MPVRNVKIFNGTPGFGKRLTKAQINNFLCSEKMNLQLGTLDNKNEPNIHPVWYIYQNGRFYFTTEVKSNKFKNIQRKREVYFSISNEKEPYIGVRGKGVTRVLDDRESSASITKKIIKKYLGIKKSKLAKEILNEIENGVEKTVEIKPIFYSTWLFST